MDLSVYIKQLLYRYDCVIVPDFGGFIANLVSSQLKNDTITPPRKCITFNGILKHNDGLLVNYIASELSCSYPEALARVQVAVACWRTQLQYESISLEGIGVFNLSPEQKIIFKPFQKINYYTDSYGFSPCKAEKINTSFADLKHQNVHFFNLKNTFKYAAGLAILFAVGAFSYRSLILNKVDGAEKTQAAGFLSQKNKTAAAEIFVKNPLKKQRVVKKYYIVLGAFRQQKNIIKYKKRIADKGFTPEVLPKNEKGIAMVVLGGFHSKKQAGQLLRKAKKVLQKDAWIFTKKL